MKKLALITLSIALLLSFTEAKNTRFETKEDKMVDLISSGESRDDSCVWICTGPRSRKYHNSKYCKGLRKCSGELKSISISEAESIGRKPCKNCYK